MREKKRVFKGIKQKAKGNGSTKTPVNKLFINKLRTKFENIMNKPFEKLTEIDVREMKMIKIIMENI